MEQVLIIGAGGHGRVVLEILKAQGVYGPAGFLDADASLAGTRIGGLPVLGQVNAVPRLAADRGIRRAIVAIGDNHVRRQYGRLLAEEGLELVNAIHPSAVVSPSAKLGRNIVIAPGAVVGVEAELGDDVVVNTGALIDHECRIGGGAHIAPGVALAGKVRIGVEVLVGLGARVLPCLSVGDGAIVGAGAVVVRDVPAGVTVVGVPARVMR